MQEFANARIREFANCSPRGTGAPLVSVFQFAQSRNREFEQSVFEVSIEELVDGALDRWELEEGATVGGEGEQDEV